MNSGIFKIILLQGLPASGKSAIRKYILNTDREILKQYHIGEPVFLDDFPYVRIFHRIDNELEAIGQKRVFYPGNEPLYDGRDWGTLCKLLNEDYYDLMNKSPVAEGFAAATLFERIDNAALQVGIPPRLGLLDKKALSTISKGLEEEARAILNKDNYINDSENKTVIIEYSRGGAAGAVMPLLGTCGYQYSLPLFYQEILRNAAILYIRTTAEESKRKNSYRINPNNTHPNLSHDIPLSVMLNNYGSDDTEYLIHISEIKDTITVTAYGEVFHIPVGVFDNYEDKTGFLYSDPKLWNKREVCGFSKELLSATETMFINYHVCHPCNYSNP